MADKPVLPPTGKDPHESSEAGLQDSSSGSPETENPDEEWQELESPSDPNASPASAYLVVILVLVGFLIIETWWAYQDLKQKAALQKTTLASSSTILSPNPGLVGSATATEAYPAPSGQVGSSGMLSGEGR